MSRLLLTVFLFLIYFSVQAQLYRDQVEIILDVQYQANVQIADLDGDGDQDILGTKAGHNGSYSIYFNLDGAGNYSIPVSFGDTTWVDIPSTNSVYRLGDMDNDGDLDVVSARLAAGSIPYYVNDGNGNFSLPDINITDEIGLNNLDEFKIADIDNDGFQDVVILEGGSNDLYYNRRVNEEAYFTTTLIHDNDSSLGWSYADNFLLFDYDLDGDLDYVVITDHETDLPDNDKQLSLILYEQTCELCFEEKTIFPIDHSTYSLFGKDLQVADINNDGYPEILLLYGKYVSSQNVESYLLILENQQGNGSFSLQNSFPQIKSFAVTDYNQDTKTDLFLSVSQSNFTNVIGYTQYFWYENQDSFEFSFHLINEEYLGDIVYAADINQDEITDLLCFNTYRDINFGVIQGEMNFDFAPHRYLGLSLNTINNIAKEDWNNDGYQDLLFYHDAYGSKSEVYRITNQGDGTYEYPSRLLTAATKIHTGDFVDVNMDGKLDFISWERPNSGNANSKIVYHLQQINDSWGPRIEVSSDPVILVNEYTISDWDNDEDPDILIMRHSGDFFFLKNTLNAEELFEPIFLDIQFPYSSDSFQELFAEDFNLDGTPDILLFQNRQLYYAQSLSTEPEYTSWDTITQPENITLLDFHVADFTADNHADILVLGQNSGNTYFLALASFNTITQSFSPLQLINYNVYGIPSYYSTIDLNGDGAMDLLSGDGFHINQANGGYFSAAYLPLPLDNSLSRMFTANALLMDIDNDTQEEIVSGSSSILAYDYDFMNRSLLFGTVRKDTTGLCQIDSLSSPMPDWLISIEGPTQSQVATTNNTGQYGSILPEIGEHKIEVIPPSGYWGVCLPDSTLMVLDSTSSFTVDFAAEALVECPLLVIDMSSTSISQCFNSTVAISYYNAGTAIAEDAVIILSFDQRLNPISSTTAWSNSTDTTLIYEFSTVDVGERGFISIVFEPNCEQLVLDEALCFEAGITPDKLCEDILINWDGANLEAEVLCEDGDLSYRIVNTGEGAMAEAEIYRVSIVNDDIVLYLSGGVILGPGEADTIPLPASEDTWHLSVGQTTGHPYPVPVSLIANACDSDNDPETTNLLPNGVGNPFLASLCRTVIGPYDPNDKSAIPIGLGEDHEIERTWPLDYTIQFQNVGTDQARTVILHDRLSELLDLSTFEPGPASHPYEWAILDDRLLIVTFSDINLLDSTSNEAASQGFFSFRIQPKNDVPFDTVIENHADIYFDFNAPIRTGTVFHTIRKPVYEATTQVDICPGDNYLGITIVQDTTLRVRYQFAEYDSVHWHHINVYPPQLTEVVVSLEAADWWEGIYIAQDTTITDIQTDIMGCDSTVVYQLQILTNTDQIALDQAVQIQPNPVQDACWISWSGLSSPELILVYNQLGQQVGAYYPSSGSKQYQLPTKQLAAGSYNVRLHWKDKQANTILQVIR